MKNALGGRRSLEIRSQTNMSATEDVVTKQQERYRVCAVCGRRHGPTYGFQAMLEGLGMKGVWAAPGCVAKLISFREAERRLHKTINDHDV